MFLARGLAGVQHQDHDARSLKPVRAQPLTPLVTRYSDVGLLAGPLDVNNLCFPVEYCDSRVAQALDLFSGYERKQLADVYDIQAASRGEVTSEEDRLSLKGLLGRTRKLDWVALKEIVEHVGRACPIEELDRKLEACAERKGAILAGGMPA